ncbi:MAG: 50S ribosomal protein L4 [Clostridium sp.]|nr:50S ribosomal protein L4 [Clostridium sp.]
MPTVGLFNIEGNKVGDVSLNENIFNTEVNENVLHHIVVAQLSNKRQGTQSAKTRAEVRGGGAKPWRQKGTGRARHGSIRSPQWVGGGVVFAAKPRSYRVSVPKSMRRVAMKSALTTKVNGEDIIVLEDLNLDTPKTKTLKNMLDVFEANKALIVTLESNLNVYKSGRNITGVKVVPVNNINVYDLLKYDKLIITKDAVSKLEEVYA